MKIINDSLTLSATDLSAQLRRTGPQCRGYVVFGKPCNMLTWSPPVENAPSAVSASLAAYLGGALSGVAKDDLRAQEANSPS